MGNVRVRVRYSSILNYLAQLYRVIIALAFSVIVARRLSVVEYGLWVTIMSVYSSLWTPSVIWRWWGSRFFARGVEGSAETALTLNLGYAPLMCLLLAVVGYAYGLRIGWGFEYFLVITIMVPLDMINFYLISMLTVTKPEAVGYSVMIYETARLTYAFILVAVLKLTLIGALLAPILALASALAVYTIRTSIKEGIPLKPSLNKELMIKWFKGAYIPAISSLSRFLLNLDKAVLTAVTGFTQASAFLGVASIPRSVLMRGAGALSAGLYAKLLRVPSSRDVEDVIRIALLIGIGEVALLITLAKPIMSLLNPAYARAPYLMILMSIESFLLMIGGLFTSVASGAERADLIEEKVSKLTKTPLFKLPTFFLIRNLLSLLVATGVATYYLIINTQNLKPEFLALIYALTWVTTAPPYVAYTYLWAKKKVHFRFPTRELLAFTLASIAASITLVLSNAFNIVVKHFWSDAPPLILASLIALAIYLGISLALSPWLRKFIRAGLVYIGVIASESEGVLES